MSSKFRLTFPPKHVLEPQLGGKLGLNFAAPLLGPNFSGAMEDVTTNDRLEALATVRAHAELVKTAREQHGWQSGEVTEARVELIESLKRAYRLGAAYSEMTSRVHQHLSMAEAVKAVRESVMAVSNEGLQTGAGSAATPPSGPTNGGLPGGGSGVEF